MIKSICSTVAVLVALEVTLAVTQAETFEWYGDGYWSNISNWNPVPSPGPSGPPGEGDIAVILGGVAKIVGGEEKIQELQISPSPHSGTGVKIFDEGLGGGWLTTQRAYIGYATNSNGTADVTVDAYSPTGPATSVKWTNTGDLIVGYKNTQDVNTLNILNAATVTSGRGFIADFPLTRGIATVDGSYTHGASIWDSGSELRVGNLGHGTLNVSNRGRVFTSGDLIVGSQSTATNQMNISSGAVVASNRGFLGDYGWFVDTANAVGQATVTGTDSMWDSGTELRVGNAGNGTLTIQDFGTVKSDVGRIAMHPQSVGNASVGSGSNWTMKYDLTVGPGGRLSLGGGVVTAPLGVTIASSGSLADRGLHGSGTVAGNVVNSGNVHPSNPLAPLTINGNYTQTSSGELNTDLDGDGIGKLVVNGSIALTGALNVTNLDFPFWEPEIGQSYDILDWVGGPSGISGSFSSTTLPAIHGSKMWNKSRLYTTGVISVSHDGDFNDDSRVDAADYTVWRDGLGTTTTQAGYDLWKSNFGYHAGSGAGAATSAPEPAAMVLALIAAAWLCVCRTVAAKGSC